MDKERASRVLDDLNVDAMDPLRGTMLDFAMRPMDEQMLHFLVTQIRDTTRLEELELKVDEHVSQGITRERLWNGVSAFGLTAALVVYWLLGSPALPSLP